jgi:hypothetical protein
LIVGVSVLMALVGRAPRSCGGEAARGVDSPAAPENPAGESELASEPKPREVEAELSGDEAKEVLERLTALSRETRRPVRSAIIFGTFGAWERGRDEPRFRELVKGRMALYADAGKQQIRLNYEKRLQKTIDLPEGAALSRSPRRIASFIGTGTETGRSSRESNGMSTGGPTACTS